MNQNKGQAPYNNCDKADTISLRNGSRPKTTSGSDNRCHILYQLRQATDVKGSMKAVFAADAGIEWAFYNEKKLEGALPYPNSGPKMTNGSKVTITKNAADPLPLKSVGQSGRSARAFQAGLPPAP